MFARVVVMAVVATLCHGEAAGQDRVSLQMGAGLLGNGSELFERDFHAIGSASAFGPWKAIGIRGDAIVGTYPVVGASVALVARWPNGGTRPYFFAGYSYQRTSQEERVDRKQDFGVIYGIGLVKELGGREWYVEISPRLYGNVFYERAQTRTLIPSR